jgi:chromosome segregation ATPase
VFICCYFGRLSCTLTWSSAEREVKKANRELATSMDKHSSQIARIEHLSRRYAALVVEMKKLEHDHKSTKRKHDLMQKERDAAKSELTKVTAQKDKLEKLSRDAIIENRNYRVRNPIVKVAFQSHINQEHQQKLNSEDLRMRDELEVRIASLTDQVLELTQAKAYDDEQNPVVPTDDV